MASRDFPYSYNLVECGPPEWGGVGSSPLETWSFDIGAPNEILASVAGLITQKITSGAG